MPREHGGEHAPDQKDQTEAGDEVLPMTPGALNTACSSKFGEDGGSGSLQLAGGTEEMVLSVRRDLQDFLAESMFAWDELGEPKHPAESAPVCRTGR